jgi:hypothetical protein
VSLLCALPAQAQYFGKNKVQYKDYRWRVLETRHFEILFYENEREIVHDAARMAERAYVRIARTLQHDIGRKIPLILYASHSDFQQTHITPSLIDVGTGGITDLARRRVFLPFTGSFGEFEHVLTHELVHAFEIDLLFDPVATDPLNPFAYAPPLWIMEGLAEYLSRPKLDTHTDMWMRDAALSGHLLSVEEMAHVRDIRVYRFGQSIFEFFAARYGEEQIGDLLRALRDHRSLDAALEHVVGVSLRAFSDAWTTSVRRRHLPELAEREVVHEFAQPVVTREEERANMLLVPSISPDGRWLAYVSDAGLTRDLYLRDLESDRGPRRVVQGDVNGDFESLRFFRASSAWSPDSRTLAFTAQAGGQDALYLVDVERRRVVASHRFGLDELQTPTFSSDGEEILFVGIAGGQSNLYRVRTDGTELQALTSDRFTVRDPQWSPDGRSVVYVTDEGPGTDLDDLRFGRLHLVLLDVASGARRDVTPFPHGKAVSPAWSGDGEYIAFISDHDGVSNIHLLHLATGAVFRVTDSVTGIGGILPSSPALSWSRDTNRLVFSAFSRGGWDLYRIDDPQQKMTPIELQPDAAIPAVASAAHTSSSVQRAAFSSPLLSSQASSASSPTEEDVTPGASGSTEFKERRYKPRLAPDLSQVGGVVAHNSGIGGASQIHFSDLLGNHHLGIGFGIYGSLKDSELLVDYLNRSGRTSYRLAAFQYQRRYGFLVQPIDTVERQTYVGVQATALRPFNKFSRLEASLQVSGVRGRFFLGQTLAEAEADGNIQTVQAFVGPGLTYVVDTALFGSTGPILGRRMRIGLEVGVGQLHFAAFQADMRQYWNVNGHSNLAARVYLGSSWGPTPRTFYLGGAYTLRGYDYGALVGNHAALASLEFRFPLLRYVALGWPLPLELGNIRGALFVDAASAWDSTLLRTSRAVIGELPGRGPQIAYGFGTRINLGAVILRFDWARRYDTRWGALPSGSNVSIGADF